MRELVFAARHGTPDELPESVETLLTTRIDTLDPSDRILLRYASVVGPTFHLDLLGSIAGGEIAGSADPVRWERLGEFVVPLGDGSLSFRHDLVRATAYAGLSFRRRREIHLRVGLALEERATGEGDEDASLLSLHFAEAGEHERAWRYASAAGRRASDRFANVVAAGLFERALQAADELEHLPAAEVVDVAEALGDVCERFGSYDRAADAYARALELLVDDTAAETRLAAKRGSLRERVGEYDEAMAIYEQGLALLDSLPKSEELERNRAAIEICAAGVRYRQGRFEETVRWAELAGDRAEQTGDRARVAHANYLVAAAYNELGRPDGIAYCERALPIFEELSDYGGMGRTLNTLGIRFYYAGRWDEAVDAYRRGREALERAGDVVGAATLANNEGEVLSDQGRLEEAEAPFQHFSRVSRATGYAIGEGAALSNLARLDARAGRFDEAHALFAQAREVFDRIGSTPLRHEAAAREAECFVLEGRYAEALGLLEEQPEDPPPQTAILVERTLGYALHQARRPDEGRPHLEESLGLAQGVGSEYEEALSLRALADTRAAGPEGRDRAEATLARLGVIRLPPVPLP